ncbi:lamin tail domain-containing protein [Streptomyces sp. NBC_01465]|uniref:lamin tail domain-containing protein n=1 Tax=Streptomyces sp. NBC_01465 TaxID=2903878 RepID=UPI002E34FB41|nr:lamin tail domain-containing protein [Streptomyces sp. NBC_01465]
MRIRTAAPAALAVAALAGALLVTAPSASAAVSPVQISKVQYDSPGKDVHTNKSVNGEWVRLQNRSKGTVSIKGWKLVDTKRHVYTFGNVSLKKGQSVTVYTGKGKDTTASKYQQRGWMIWNNTHDTATLSDAKGAKKDAVKWTKPGKGYVTS